MIKGDIGEEIYLLALKAKGETMLWSGGDYGDRIHW
jgi:hypothetical protein